MEISQLEQGGLGEHERAILRAMVLQTEERIRELHKRGGGDPRGLGIIEAVSMFPSELEEFIGKSEDVLFLSLEEEHELNILIQQAAKGELGEPGHKQELDQFLDYFLRYRIARTETRH